MGRDAGTRAQEGRDGSTHHGTTRRRYREKTDKKIGPEELQRFRALLDEADA